MLFALLPGCASTLVVRAPWDSGSKAAGFPRPLPEDIENSSGTNDEPHSATMDRLARLKTLGTAERAALAADLEKVPLSLQPLVLQQLEAAAESSNHAPAEANPLKSIGSKAAAHEEEGAEPSSTVAAGAGNTGFAENEASASNTSQASGSMVATPRAADPVEKSKTSSFDRLAALARTERKRSTLPEVVGSAAQAVASNTTTVNQAAMLDAEPRDKTARTTGPPGVNWRGSLYEAIERLESELASEPAGDDPIMDQVRLRLLHLAAGNREKALEPIPSLSTEADAFLTETLFGLDIWLDERRIAEEDRRAAAALPHFADAIGHLGEVASLVVRNLQLCTAVHSFGVVEPFKSGQFRPGQEVLVYAEVENFHSREVDKGFQTVLEGSILVFDSRGHRVGEIELPKKEDVCSRRRRDFFLVYQVQLPQRLYPGSHSLKLTVEDAGCRKVGQATLKFAVSEASE